jgi:hypothetical protein
VRHQTIKLIYRFDPVTLIIKAKQVKKERVLEDAPAIFIYEHYTNETFKVGVALPTPWRKDRTPSFTFFIAHNGTLMWKDLAYGDSGDCFKFVGMMFGLTYNQAVTKVYNDLVLDRPAHRAKQTYSKTILAKAMSTYKFDIATLAWDHDTLAYWHMFGINQKVLEFYNVHAVDFYTSNGYPKGKYSQDNPIYAYILGNEQYKIYRPFSVTDKWRTNSCAIQGFNQLPKTGEILIITKSLKDVMVLYQFGYNAIAPPSESTFIDADTLSDLYKRFPKIIIFYDNDDAGIKNATEYGNKHKLKAVWITELSSKDISDLYKDHGKHTAQCWLKEHLWV